MNKLFVFDTNILISAALFPSSINRQALDKALEFGKLAISKNTTDELLEVIFRKKFDKYFLNNEERLLFISKVEANSRLFSPEISINECRDAKDNKFLELAISAEAACILSGDKDLLVMHPFRGIPILNSNKFLINI